LHGNRIVRILGFSFYGNEGMTHWKLLLFLLLISTAASAQDDPLQLRLDFSVENQSLESALYSLIDVSDVNISFSNSILPSKKISNLQFRNERLGVILSQLLSGTNIEIRSLENGIVLVPGKPPEKRKFTISGYLRDADSGEPLIGANIYEPGLNQGTSSNAYGFYSLTLQEGAVNILFSYLGYERESRQFRLDANKVLEVELTPSLTLQEIVVTDRLPLATGPSGSISSGEFIPEDMEAMPALGGESDILRLSYTLPGVQTGADGIGGMAVRGGNIDQNLILLDGVPVYNSTHLLGIYSVFNSSAIRSAQLVKGGFPARYGGRVSSVLDVRTKEGNNRQYSGEADIGLTSGKVSLEGPIVKGKSSFFISGRRSFTDFFSRPISRYIRSNDNIEGELGYYFYDLNAKLNYYLSSKDKFYLSFYTGGDNYEDESQFGVSIGDSTLVEDSRQLVSWGNTIAAFRWNHLFSNKLFLNTTATYSTFSYESFDFFRNTIFVNFQPVESPYQLYQYASNNQDIALKMDFDFVPAPNHYIRFGAHATYHSFQPGAIAVDESFQLDSITLDSINLLIEKSALLSRELDFYFEDEWQVCSWMKTNFGARGSFLLVQGENRFYFQPRLLFSFLLREDLELSTAVGRTVQSLHLLTNSGIGLPRDLWVSATARIDPIDSWQTVLGLRYRLPGGVEVSLEGYYKTLNNLITFREGSLTNIDGTNWQNKVSVGRGWSYGLECLIEKKQGRLTGWLSYTLARSDRQFDDVNLGQEFPYKFDRRHNFNLLAAYALSKRWSISGGWTYSTGTATTLPRSTYEFNQLNIVYSNLPPLFPYVLNLSDNGARNDLRLPDYHRLDLSVRYKVQKKRWRHTFTAGVYNIYNRLNPLYYQLANRPNDQGALEAQYLQVSLLPVLPSVRYRADF
jgi:outer membrane receptor for ferrienterochelin and colicin